MTTPALSMPRPPRERAIDVARRRWSAGPRRRDVRLTVRVGSAADDVLVVLPGRAPALRLERAQALGLVSEEGYLTPAGFRLLRGAR